MTRSGTAGVLAGALAALAWGSGPARGDDEARAEPPPYTSEGELAFSLDMAGFRGAGPGVTEEEIYVSVTNDQLEFPGNEEDDAAAPVTPSEAAAPLEGELLLEIRLSDRDGREVARLESPLRPQAASRLDAEDRGILQVIREQVAVAPGLYRLEATLTDQRSQKVGLFNRMRNAKNRGRLETWVEVPALDAAGMYLSDLAFVRSARAAEEGTSYGRHGVDFDPNPSRFYGLVLPAVKYYLEVYAGDAYAPGDRFLVLSQVNDLSGTTVTERRSRAVPADASFVITDAVNLAENVPAGRYDLAVTVLNERTNETARVERPFDVLWSLASWGQDPGRMLEEMALVMTDGEFDALERLSPGAQEVYLAEFWHKLDPTPDTAENEVFDEFRRRVRLADRNYGQTLRRGVLTDRGRVLVRYGIPDDVEYRYSSSGFGPDAGGPQVSEPGERADLTNRPSTSFLTPEEFREGDVSGLATQRGGTTIKSKQLEVWTYDGRGSPLRPDHQDWSAVSHRGLKFLFADEMGNGEYQLVGSEGATVY